MMYFDFEKSLTDENNCTKTYCKCQFCKEIKNGTNDANLGHLKSCNPVIHSKITGGEKDPIAVKRMKLIHNLTEIVAVNGRTFTSLGDSSFSTILSKELDELSAAKCPINLSDGNFSEIKDNLTKTAENIRTKIKSEVKGKTLGLMADIVTKHHRSLLVVSIQYMHNGKPKVRSIGLVELHQRISGLYLAEKVIEIMKEYEIETMQIISITTDNGSNIVKMVRDIENLQETNQQKSVDDQNASDSNQVDSSTESNKLTKIMMMMMH